MSKQHLQKIIHSCLANLRALLFVGFGIGSINAETLLKIDPNQPQQEFQGMGCGAIFYEAHITSLATTNKQSEQSALYDAMCRDVRTNFLQLMIRHNHEPVNDNAEPQIPDFDLKTSPTPITPSPFTKPHVNAIHKFIFTPHSILRPHG